MVILKGWKKEVDRTNTDEHLHISYFRYVTRSIMDLKGVTKIEIIGIPDAEKYNVVFWDGDNVVWTVHHKDYQKARRFALKWMKIHPYGSGKWS